MYLAAIATATNPGSTTPGQQLDDALADLQAAAAAELDHARAQAQDRIDAAEQARTRAQADAEHAQRQAEALAAEVSQLRAELAQLHTDSRDEEARIRQEVRSDREALRAQYTEQLIQVQQSADARATALTRISTQEVRGNMSAEFEA